MLLIQRWCVVGGSKNNVWFIVRHGSKSSENSHVPFNFLLSVLPCIHEKQTVLLYYDTIFLLQNMAKLMIFPAPTISKALIFDTGSIFECFTYLRENFCSL
jgi:hypothetical protein